MDIVGKAIFNAQRGKVTFKFEGYVSKTLNEPILCGGPFIERNKIVQELNNKRIVIENKFYIMETSPYCPNPTPEVQITTITDKPGGARFTTTETPGGARLPKTDKYTSEINIDANIPLPHKHKLDSIHAKYNTVFDNDLQTAYNGCSGNFDVDFNFKNGVTPPVHLGCVPSYNTHADDVLMQAMIDKLEDQNIVAKANNINIIPKFASPAMLVLKQSAKNIPKQTLNNMPTTEKLKYHRFVLCQNKLNEYVDRIPAMYTKIEDTIRTVGTYEYVITTDLTDSFWQRQITASKLPYFAFHSPFKGTYIFLRSSQGFINQSEGLEEMVKTILHRGVSLDWVRVHADNIYVLGHTYEETIQRWQEVLQTLLNNNLKLSAKKTHCFPAKMDLLGWTKEGKFLTPDPHRQNSLELAELPTKVKELRSYLGSYRTFYKSKENMSTILGELEQMVSDKPSSEKLDWTPQLTAKFYESRTKIKTLDKLYLPKPQDQLVLTSDWSKSGISATLWAKVDDKFHVVSRFSCKTDKARQEVLPCEGECYAVYVAMKCPNFTSHIRSSQPRTICLVDNKPVYQAANLLKKGQFSTSKFINHLLTAISEFNIEFQHISGKMGQNFVDDYGSRHSISCQNSDDCTICQFVDEATQLTIGSISFSVQNLAIVGNIPDADDNKALIQNIITGQVNIPFNNRKAMKYLQDQDPDLLKLREYLTSGKRPQGKNNKENSIKRYLQQGTDATIARDGCIVVNKVGKKLTRNELIVIPQRVSLGLLQAMHINLNHPTSYQLMKVTDTKFFILDRDKKIQSITSDCTQCQSMASIPKELETFEANQIPDHPGKSFTVDVMKFAKKNIVVATENFSGFISTQIVPTEQQTHLEEGIIQTVTPFKVSTLSRIRVDQAPGFKALLRKPANLKDLGIDLDPGQAKNKNALALVDTKMSELRKEIIKAAPHSNVVDVKILAQATSAVNEKERNQGLSSKEILFSRDQFTNENLPIQDEKIATETMKLREQNNIYTAKSKATVAKPAATANAKTGQLVFLKHETYRTAGRDLYLVTAASDDTITICKLASVLSDATASFQPHNISYTVKQTDVYLAPNQPYQLPEWYAIYGEGPHFPQDSSLENYYPDNSPNGKEGKHKKPGGAWQQKENTDQEEVWSLDETAETQTEQPAHQQNLPRVAAEEVEAEQDPNIEPENQPYQQAVEQDQQGEQEDEGVIEQPEQEGSDEQNQSDTEEEQEGSDEQNQSDIEEADPNEPPTPWRQDRKPQKKDKVVMFNTTTDLWKRITLTSGENRNYKHYYNYQDDTGHQGGICLRPGDSWALITEEEAIPQIEGAYATPDESSESSIRENEEQRHNTRALKKPSCHLLSNISISPTHEPLLDTHNLDDTTDNYDQYWDLLAHSNPVPSYSLTQQDNLVLDELGMLADNLFCGAHNDDEDDVFNDAYIASPEFDPTKVQNVEHLLPPEQFDPNKVQNLDHVLPIESSPKQRSPTDQRRNRANTKRKRLWNSMKGCISKHDSYRNYRQDDDEDDCNAQNCRPHHL